MKIIYGLLLAGALGGGALLAAPAVWLDPLLSHQTKGGWRLAVASGTAWHGSGQLVQLGADGKVEPLKTVRWQLLPSQLRSARLAWVLSLGAERATVSWGPGGWHSTGVHQVLPAALILALAS